MGAETKTHTQSKFLGNLKYLQFNDFRKEAPKYLVREPFDELNHVGLQGATETLREWNRGHWKLFNSTVGLIGYAVSGEGTKKYLNEEFVFYTVKDLADRRANGWIGDITSQSTESARVIELAREMPEHADHGAPHARREELYEDGLVGSDSRLRHKQSIKPWLHSIHGAFITHDLGQLLSLLRNTEEGRIGTKRELIVKGAHDLEGSALALIYVPEYERVSKFDEKSAKLMDLDTFMPDQNGPDAVTLSEFILFGTGVMQMHHEEMDIYDDSLHGTVKAYELGPNQEKIPLSDELLYHHYENHTLDKFSLAFADIIRLTKIKKQLKGFEVSDEPLRIGLHPAIEAEKYDRIVELSQDYRRPFDHFDEKQRESFIRGAEVKAWTDEIEKNSPARESVTRTTLTQYSREREWTIDVEPDVMLREIFEGRGQPNSPLNSDTMRMLWEIVHQDAPIKSEALRNNDYIKRLSRDSAIMRAIAIRDIGIHVMAGDTNYLRGLYEDRLYRLEQKALHKAGFKPKEIKKIMLSAAEYAEMGGDSMAMIAEYIRNNDLEKAERFLGIAQNLARESEAVINGFRCKPDFLGGPKKRLEDNPSIKQYSHREIENFKVVVNTVISEICRKNGVCTDEELKVWMKSGYQITPIKLAAYEEKVASGEFPEDTPFNSYDQFASSNHRRMVLPLESLAEVNSSTF